MTASTTRSAFELYREPSTVREQYGRHKFGQSTLLARRLIEAGGRLAQDLEERGPLSETLVAVFGEFGRTPKFIRYGGRDHLGACFSMALAGAGVEGGRVIGASDRDGSYPIKRPVRADELSATLHHLLGIDPHRTFNDRLDRPLPIANAPPTRKIVGWSVS